MKTTLIVFLILTSLIGYGQVSKEDIFNPSREITFLGVDYSQAQFVGPVTGWGEETTKSPSEIRDTYFLAWNNQIEKEPNNYKFAESNHSLDCMIRFKPLFLLTLIRIGLHTAE